VRAFAAGQSATGFVAVGQFATGVIAIGQGAQGVIAIGQLSRGVIAVGQLALGVVAFGQLAVGFWSGGMVSLGVVRGPALFGAGTFARLGARDLVHLRWHRGRWLPRRGTWRAVAGIVTAVVVVIVGRFAVEPVIHELTRVGGILRDPPRRLQ
jgi:hypothetical protein